MQQFLMAGSVLGFLAVLSGAFGAHALQAKLQASGRQPSFDAAVRYQLAHALALTLIALLSAAGGALPGAPALLRWSGWLFVAGSVLFCGPLYVLALGGARRWGAVAPVGGGALLAGWALLFAYALAAR
jgi:uncharacterized membrane protein YgdD (TMEM256/DUF423 family)